MQMNPYFLLSSLRSQTYATYRMIIILASCHLLRSVFPFVHRSFLFISGRASPLGAFAPRRVRAEREVRRLARRWARFDPVGGGRINLSLVRPLLHQLPRPLGFGKRIRSQPLSVYEEESFLTILTELQVCSTSSFPV